MHEVVTGIPVDCIVAIIAVMLVGSMVPYNVVPVTLDRDLD
jgi:hypothetical protein